jgi:hypothetical protein
MAAVPLKEFANNEWYASYFGLTLWNLGASCCTEIFELPVSTLLNTRVWNIGKWGVYGYGSNRVTFDGWTHLNDPALLYQGSSAFHFGDYITRNTIIRRADIVNVNAAVIAPHKAGDTRDIYGATPGTLVVEDSSLTAVTGLYLETPWAVTGGGRALPPRRTLLRNVRMQIASGNPGYSTPGLIFPSYRTDRPNHNFTVSDEIEVQAFNGVPGDNFRVYYEAQSPGFVVPVGEPDGIVGAPTAGLTNAQAWAQFKIAIGSSVAPCTTTRPGIIGFTCPITGSTPSSLPRPRLSAPTGVRILK